MKIGIYESGNWENRDYEEINRKICRVMNLRDKLAERQDKYAAEHGEFSEEIDEQYNKLTDELEDLCRERDEISKRMSS